MQVSSFTKSRLIKKIIAYGFFPLAILFFAFSPVLSVPVAHAGSGCNFFAMDVPKCLGSGVSSLVIMLNTILGFFLYLSGILLDFTIKFSIDPGDLYKSNVVSVAWNLLRDIINISFIFILLYVAIGTVLNIGSVNWKKMVPAIIIAAILINFSLFITRVVIDAGNILANSFYTQLTACGPNENCEDGNHNPRDKVGISERFMNALSLTTITDLKVDKLENNDMGWAGVSNNLMKTVLILVAFWVFVTAAMLFIGRTFALIFILVLSPIGIAGSGLPLLNKYAKQWREELFKQSMMGVVFLFFIFIVMTFAVTGKDLVAKSGLGLGADNASQYLGNSASGDEAQVLFVLYVLVIAGLIMAIRLTKTMSGQAGQFFDGIAKAAVGVSIAAATGGTALALRGTVGRHAAAQLKGTKGDDLKKAAAEGGRKGRVAMKEYNRMKSRAESSYDVRNTKFGGIATDRVAKLAGVNPSISNVGKDSGKGGRSKREKDITEKKAKKFADFDSETLQTEAKRLEKKTGKKAGYGRQNKSLAEQLRKDANKKRVGKEEVEKKVEKATLKLQGLVDGSVATEVNQTVEQAIHDILDSLGPSEIANLPDEVLMSDGLKSHINMGDMRAIKGKAKRSVIKNIVQSNKLQQSVQDYVDNPKNDFPDSGRDRVIDPIPGDGGLTEEQMANAVAQGFIMGSAAGETNKRSGRRAGVRVNAGNRRRNP